jgi:hypothetical protein
MPYAAHMTLFADATNAFDPQCETSYQPLNQLCLPLFFGFSVVLSFQLQAFPSSLAGAGGGSW